jgi:imidazolonepropionase-like amidohydrolase
MRIALAFAAALGLLSAAASAETVAITNGRVHTVSGQGVIEGGTVLIRDGRIAAVGKGIAVPTGARLIDASGKWVTPGLISAWSQLGLVEVETINTTNDSTASDAPFAAGFDVSYGVNPDSTIIPTARIGGVTRAAIFPLASRSIFVGFGAIIQTGEKGEPLFVPRALALAEMGATGARIAGGARGAAWVAMEQAFDKAAKGGPLDPDDVDGAAVKAILAGTVPFVVHVERAPDILQALAMKKRHPAVKLVLIGVTEGWRVADRVAAAGVPVIVDSYANLPVDFETMGATQENVVRLARAGVTVAIAPLNRFSAGAPHDARLVAQFAGNAVGNGLPWAEGLKAVTLNPARIFGVADRLGSLEPGKIADVVVWDGDPLELGSEPDVLLIAGKEESLVSRQTKLFQRYRDKADPKPFSYRR